ncbi:MAG TPA: tRNA (adenosine(37)-N6)-threonylcarbamoyltransferase complex ATPase subunit type 1 TsaE, partial [Campylobacterales bacterium]|nr:tRNA (adenosine(37)-N6)-threonylcarbamoyltransferase complex ATPase subunit type 1 TsaE [Campylobacterales bacterium]
MKEIIASPDEIEQVANYLIETIPKNAIIFLIGNLAAGKTTLTSHIVKAKGISLEVTSPTFSLQHCYGDALYHYDLYRIEHHEFMELGLFEEFEKSGWHLVEWGSDTLKAFLLTVGYELYTVTIEPLGERRKYRI